MCTLNQSWIWRLLPESLGSQGLPGHGTSHLDEQPPLSGAGSLNTTRVPDMSMFVKSTRATERQRQQGLGILMRNGRKAIRNYDLPTTCPAFQRLVTLGINIFKTSRTRTDRGVCNMPSQNAAVNRSGGGLWLASDEVIPQTTSLHQQIFEYTRTSQRSWPAW